MCTLSDAQCCKVLRFAAALMDAFLTGYKAKFVKDGNVEQDATVEVPSKEEREKAWLRGILVTQGAFRAYEEMKLRFPLMPLSRLPESLKPLYDGMLDHVTHPLQDEMSLNHFDGDTLHTAALQLLRICPELQNPIKAEVGSRLTAWQTSTRKPYFYISGDIYWFIHVVLRMLFTPFRSISWRCVDSMTTYLKLFKQEDLVPKMYLGISATEAYSLLLEMFQADADAGVCLICPVEKLD